MKVVLDTKPTSGYDDEIAYRYHFPSRYLSIMSDSLDDWAVFRRPRADGGSLAYFGAAKIAQIEPDQGQTGRYYAKLDHFIEFEKPVEWRDNGRYHEEALRALSDIRQVGLFLRGRSVRRLEEHDFLSIVTRGMAAIPDWDEITTIPSSSGGKIADDEYGARTVVAALVNRKLRDANFRKRVCGAYDFRCAVTGLKLIDANGISEAQAAHIWAVGENGPDIIQNGLSLSATVHWLFDHHLFSINDDYSLIVEPTRLPKVLLELFPLAGKSISLPQNSMHWPSLKFIARHRAAFTIANKGAVAITS